MNRYKKLVKNSGIFAIGTLGSKLMSIILLPFYTYVLSTEQYGTIDIIITSISLILPMITLSIFEATLRFSVKSNYTKSNILTSSVIIIMIGNILFILFYPILKKVNILKEYIDLFYIVVLFQSINLVFTQFCRGIGKVKEFSINGIITTFITLILNIVLLSKYNLGIQGYFISMIVSYFISNLYLITKIGIFKYINFNDFNKDLIKQMIIYSVPLIPNSLMWWVMNASDRYVITIFLGVAANGLYAVAYKIPTILNIIYSIFSQSWQLSAIEEFESDSRDDFYTNVFNNFSTIMLISTSLILLFIKPIIKFSLNYEFADSWKYIPFLLLAVVFTSFSSFLGANYIAMKKTKNIFTTSLIGAIVNLMLNFISIPILGLNGAAISTMIGFFIVWIIRIRETKEFVNISINKKSLILTLICIFLQIYILYIETYTILEIMLGLLLFMSILRINKLIIKNLLISLNTMIVSRQSAE